jgi:hypothetical protein
MPPLGQYFSPLSQPKPVESIAAPKGHGPRTLRGFFPENKQFSEDHRKGQ